MVRRSIFNNPSSPIPNHGGEDEDELHSDYPGSQPSADHDSESEIQPLSDSELVEDEDDEDNEDEGSDEEPSRWGDQEDTGTSIKPFLGVLTSLERDHNTALSKHLYSAYLLKRRRLVPEAAPPTDSDSGSEPESVDPRPKKRQKRVEDIPDSEEDDDKYLFGRGKRFITKGWTSWPHPPSFVPRESEHKISRLRSQPSRVFFDPETYSRPLQSPHPPAPSQMLEEALMATFLRISKDKLRSRPAEETGGAGPALDDDINEHVLKPVVRHVISQLDGLLTGLYHERGYAKALATKDEKAAAAAAEAAQKSKGKGRSSSYLRAKARGAKWASRKRAVTPTTDTEDEGSNEEQDSDNDDGEGTPPKKAKKSARRYPAPAPLAKKYATKRQNRLQLRDWSQLLGVAALIGWEPDALQRTAKRCEGHFGQTMSWRLLRESDRTGKPKPDELWTGARPIHLKQDRDEEGGISRDGFMQPISIQKIETASRIRYRVKMDASQPEAATDSSDENTSLNET